MGPNRLLPPLQTWSLWILSRPFPGIPGNKNPGPTFSTPKWPKGSRGPPTQRGVGGGG